MKKLLLLLALLCLPISSQAQGASANITVTVNPPNSTGITCNPASFTGSAPAGSIVCPITVAPSGWSGSLALSGANAALFVITSAPALAVGSTALGPGTYNVTLTATP